MGAPTRARTTATALACGLTNRECIHAALQISTNVHSTIERFVDQ